MGRMFFDNSLAYSSAHKPVGLAFGKRVAPPTEGKRSSHLSSGGGRGARACYASPPPPSEDPNFVVFFENVKSSKKEIYKRLRRKAGVYLIINNITKDVYVGSSVNLSKIMVCHFYHANSTKDTKIVITRAMKKYKLENFSLAILEFCAPYISICLELEQK